MIHNGNRLSPNFAVLLPQLLTFGDYQPEQRIGPVIWLRSVVDRGLPEIGIAGRGNANRLPPWGESAGTPGSPGVPG